jgi:putative transposase
MPMEKYDGLGGMKNTNSLCLMYKYRLLPNKRQHMALQRILDQQGDLYNCALQKRRDAHRRAGKTITLFDQYRSLTEIRQSCPGWNQYPTNLQRGTLRRLDEAFKGFFARVKRGETPGFPRFKSRRHLTSFEFSEWGSIRFDGKRIRFKGLPGGLRVHLHRPLPERKILTAKFSRDAKGWSVCFSVRVTCAEVCAGTRQVGLDMGITYLATFSTGETIVNPRPARAAQKEQRRRQRALARCRRGSKRRQKVKTQVARLHTKIKNTRMTYMHQVSARLVREYDYIAIENLRVRNMVKNPYLSSAIHDAGWGILANFLTYKAAKAGGTVEEKDPRNTTQDCSACGEPVLKGLGQRIHHCPHCGLVMCRDRNAAINILQRGRSGSRVAQCKAAA